MAVSVKIQIPEPGWAGSVAVLLCRQESFPFPPAPLAAPSIPGEQMMTGMAGLELWPGLISRYTREGLALILGIYTPLSPGSQLLQRQGPTSSLHFKKGCEAADNFTFKFSGLSYCQSWSGVWGWALRPVIKCFILPQVGLCHLLPSGFVGFGGFLGQMNPDFFFSEHSWPFLLSSFPPHEMILSPPEDFPPCLQGFSKWLHFNDEWNKLWSRVSPLPLSWELEQNEGEIKGGRRSWPYPSEEPSVIVVGRKQPV